MNDDLLHLSVWNPLRMLFRMSWHQLGDVKKNIGRRCVRTNLMWKDSGLQTKDPLRQFGLGLVLTLSRTHITTIQFIHW